MDCAEQIFILGPASKCWIRLLIFSVGLFGITQLRAATGSDNAANYSLWSSGGNEGTGFGPWSFESNDNGTDALAGFYLADLNNRGNRNSGIFSPDSSGKAFALSANPPVTYMVAKRFFGGANAAPLAVGESFTFKWLQYWAGGYKGINLYRGGWNDATDKVLNLRQGGDMFLAQSRGSVTSATAIANAYDNLTAVTVRRAAPDTLILNIQTEDPADIPYRSTFRSPAPDRVSFYFGNNVNESRDEPLFNNLSIEADSTPVETRQIKFSVNMVSLAAQSPKGFDAAQGDKIYVRGYPSGGWGETEKVELIQEVEGIYSVVLNVAGDTGLKSGGYKFYIQKGDGSSTTLENGGFEDGLDREFDLTANNTDLPVVYFSNIRSFVTFAVDMNVQKSKGTFNPTSGQAVELKGSFNDWGAGIAMSDLDGDGIYTVTLPIQGNSGTPLEYKFTVTGSGSSGLAWEGGLNRLLVLGSFADATPLVTYGNDGTTFAVWSGGAALNAENLAKYAIGGGSDPNAQGEAPTVGKRFIVPNHYTYIEAIVRTDDNKLSFLAESSTDLSSGFSSTGTWTVEGLSQGVSQQDVPSGCERKKFIYWHGMAQEKMFLRLRATLAP
jgi:hypothetical protein